MENEANVEINRLDDDIVEIKTVVTQKLTNQEFYDMWASEKVKETQNKQMVKQNEQQIKQAISQNEIITKRIERMTKMAKDCEARLPSKPKPVKKLE